MLDGYGQGLQCQSFELTGFFFFVISIYSDGSSYTPRDITTFL